MSGENPRISGTDLEAIPVGQTDVQHHDVGLQVASQGEGLVRGARISHDAQPLLRIEECAETVANERVIVHDQDRDLHSWYPPPASLPFARSPLDDRDTCPSRVVAATHRREGVSARPCTRGTGRTVTERKGGTTVETPAADAVGRTGRIRVMIADDEEAVRDALTSLIAEDPEISVVGTGGDAEQAIAIAGREHPDVALLDVRMPRGGGPRAAREIRRVSPGTELIALSADDGGQEVDAMLRAGAGAYLVKGDGRRERDRGSDPPLRPRPGWPNPPGRARAALARRASVPEP